MTGNSIRFGEEMKKFVKNVTFVHAYLEWSPDNIVYRLEFGMS